MGTIDSDQQVVDDHCLAKHPAEGSQEEVMQQGSHKGACHLVAKEVKGGRERKGEGEEEGEGKGGGGEEEGRGRGRGR